jgi:hypothetical protein
MAMQVPLRAESRAKNMEPTTWEAERGETCFEVSSGKKPTRPYLKNKPGMLFYAYNPSYSGGSGRKVPVLGTCETFLAKAKKGWGMAQVVECFA